MLWTSLVVELLPVSVLDDVIAYLH